jgi:glycosyltransferase involved in cell wall biosynthesis
MSKGRLRWALRHPRKALIKSLGGQFENSVIVQQPAVVPECAAARAPGRLSPGVNIIGYLRSEIGLGQAARNIVYAADSARLPVSLRSLPLPQRDNDPEFATKCNQIMDRQTSMLVCDLPSVGALYRDMAPGRINLLYPYWELAGIPQDWLKAARQFDEVWAPSRFIASAFADRFGKPVRLLRQPVRLPHTQPPPRKDRQELRFFTFFDFDSFGARKNPQAAVQAFRSAFPSQRQDVELIIKTRGGNDNGLRNWLQDIAAGDQRIKVIDKTLSRAAMDALMATTDVFVSLHRSEGFGFGAAEAIAAGKVVVATDFGGTTDFITGETGYPIDYSLIDVLEGEYVAVTGQVWADAKQDAAVAAFRSIYDDPDESARRTSRGFATLKADFSCEAVGVEMKKLLRLAGSVSESDVAPMA